MRISRVYVPANFEAGDALEVSGETSHYLKTVLRLRKGWQLIVFDGQGRECPATVESFGRDSTLLRLGVPSFIDRESSLELHLAIGISRGERMDLVIQKAVELGAHRISPLLTEFCVVRLDEDKKEVRHSHWQRVIRSAMEQCGRNQMPLIAPPSNLDDWLASHDYEGKGFILDPVAQDGFTRIHAPPQKLTLLIGPEGGFSDSERESAIGAGFQPVRLGPRVLRTETAVIASIAAVQTLWGDLGEDRP